jgi:ribosome-associated translation inhibitor RaiA
MQSAKDSGISKPSADDRSFENDPELKAFIYQHLIDLQPYLSAESQLAVLVGQDDSEEGLTEHALTLVATLGDYRLEAEGQDQDIYEAFIVAKRKMLQQLEDWYTSSIDSSERDNEIQAVIEGRHLIH